MLLVWFWRGSTGGNRTASSAYVSSSPAERRPFEMWMAQRLRDYDFCNARVFYGLECSWREAPGAEPGTHKPSFHTPAERIACHVTNGSTLPICKVQCSVFLFLFTFHLGHTPGCKYREVWYSSPSSSFPGSILLSYASKTVYFLPVCVHALTCACWPMSAPPPVTLIMTLCLILFAKRLSRLDMANSGFFLHYRCGCGPRRRLCGAEGGVMRVGGMVSRFAPMS